MKNYEKDDDSFDQRESFQEKQKSHYQIIINSAFIKTFESSNKFLHSNLKIV